MSAGSNIKLPQIDRSAIEWCGPTWNPWQGCTKKSQGCKNCYMYRDKKRYGQDPSVCVRSSHATFQNPLKWQREVEAGYRKGQDCLVFTCSWSDFFNEEADGWRDEAWDIIRRCPGLIFQILTKLPQRINDHLPPPEVWQEIKGRCWMGTSVENQENDWRIAELLKVDASLRFLSCEPLIGELWIGDEYLIGPWVRRDGDRVRGDRRIHWVIVGGESGPDARPMHPDWARSLRDQCVAAGVPFFFKQWGEYAPITTAQTIAEYVRAEADDDEIRDSSRRELVMHPDGRIEKPEATEHWWDEAAGRWYEEYEDSEQPIVPRRFGKKAAGRELDGREWNEWPATQTAEVKHGS